MPHGTYLFAVSSADPARCPVQVGEWPCTLPPNHAPIECANVSPAGVTRLLGVVPLATSVAMHDPDGDRRLKVAETRGPANEDGETWFARTLAEAGPCRCASEENWPASAPEAACEAVFVCPLCQQLPPDWPCPADGGYGEGSWVGPEQAEHVEQAEAPATTPAESAQPQPQAPVAAGVLAFADPPRG